MGRTITEKILDKDVGREVKVGEFVHVHPKYLVIEGISDKQMAKFGVNKAFDPKRVKIVWGSHCGTAENFEWRYETLKWVKKLGIPRENIIDIGSGGIAHQVAIEHLWPLPGSVYMCGTDGHTPMNGALGCLAEPLSQFVGENETFLITGKTWIHVPPSIKFSLSGNMQKGVMTRDIFEWILGNIGPSGAQGAVMEWTGPLIEEMSMDGRIALCCNSPFTSSFTSIINPDKITVEYAKGRTKDDFEPMISDSDAFYKKTFSFDVSAIGPQIVIPPKRHAVKTIEQIQGKRIDRGFIGTCANGRLEDMRITAKILKGNKVHADVSLTILPASTEVLKKSLQEGLIEIFIDAGAVVPSPCCGMCLASMVGTTTPLAGDEVCISTATCNYPGRMGSLNAQIYLASPTTVAVSCLEGKITDPRSYI